MTDTEREGATASVLWFAGIALLLTAARWVLWIVYRVLEKGE